MTGDTALRAARVALETARGRIGDDAPSAWVAVASDQLVEHWPLGVGELSGLTFGVKDIVDLAGMPTRCGSPLTSAESVAESAPFVDSFLRAGALPVGKTVTTEFAYFRPGPTRNPRAAGHTPGGSSSGSAAAVAAGHVDFAIGSQTAGSLIRPASYCGVAGLVLTQGVFSTDGFAGLAPSLDAPGILAPGVGDLTRLHAAIEPDARPGRVATVHVWNGADVDAPTADMASAVARAAAAFRAAGIDVRALDDGGRVAQAARDHLTIMAFEVARDRLDLVEARAALSEPLRELIDTGLDLRPSDYAAALARTADARSFFLDVLGIDGVVVGPAAPGAAPRGLDATGSPVMSRAWQALGFPQVCVAASPSSAGLPLGVQLIGAPRTETMLLDAGTMLERAVVSA